MNKSRPLDHRLAGGRQQLTCRENTTISINYLEQQWVCTEGDNCPPNIGGVIMGCPLDPPDVPGNSTGKILTKRYIAKIQLIIRLMRHLQLIVNPLFFQHRGELHLYDKSDRQLRRLQSADILERGLRPGLPMFRVRHGPRGGRLSLGLSGGRGIFDRITVR